MAVRLSDIPNTSVRLSDISVGTRLSDIPETSQAVLDVQELFEIPQIADPSASPEGFVPTIPKPRESSKEIAAKAESARQKILTDPNLNVFAKDITPQESAQRFSEGLRLTTEIDRQQATLTDRKGLGEFKTSLLRGTLNVFGGIAGTVARLSELADKPGLNWIGKHAKDFSETFKRGEKLPELTPSEVDSAGEFAQQVLGSTLPFSAAAITAGVTAGLPAAFAVAFAVEGENASQSALDSGATQEEADTERVIVGTINGAIEFLEVGFLLRNFKGGGKILKNLTHSARNKAWIKVAQFGKQFASKLALAGLGEAIEESSQGAVSELTPKILRGEEIQGGVSGFIERRLVDAAGGALGGIALGGLGATISTTADRTAAQQEFFVPEVVTKPTVAPPAVPAVAPVAKPAPKGVVIPPKPVKAKLEGKQIEVSEVEAAALLGESLERIKANVELKQRLSKELIITEFQPSDFVPKAKKGPGLTKAEQRIITPEVQGKLRFAQTQGLPVGFKAGQKEANDIAKRRLDDFRTARKIEKGILQDARKLVTEYAKDPVVAKKLITSLAKVDSPAKMAAFADKIGEFVREAERKQAITSYKTTFNQLKKDNRLGKVAFGKLRDAARVRILKFADTIDLKKLSVAKKEELESLMGKVKDLGVDLSEGIAQLDVDTQDALKQLDPHIVALDRLKKTAVSDMGLEEIQIAEDSLRYIVRQNEIQNKEIFGKRVVDAKVREKKAVEEVSVSKKQRRIFKREAKKGVIAPKKRVGVFALLKKGTVGQSRTVPTLVQVATIEGATATKDVLDTKIWDGIRKTNKVTFESVDFLKKEFTKRSITDKDILSFAKKINVTLAGNSRSVTFGDLGAIEMHLRSLDNIEQLRKTKAMWVQGKRVPGITIQEYVKAAENLTDKQLKFLDIIGNMNRTITAPAVNESTENRWGYPVARDINYWPLVRKFPVKAEGPVTAFSQAIEQQSPFQPRTGGTQDLVLVPVVEQMWQTLQVGARMAGTA